MHFLAVSKVLGRFLLYLSTVLLIPLLVAILYEFFLEKHVQLQVSATRAFIETLVICVIIASGLMYLGRNVPDRDLRRKESILLVVLIWLMSGFICALPFMFTKVMNNPVDAYFESMSGLTTTGATIIHPKSYHPETGEEVPITIENPLDPTYKYTFYGTVAPLKDVNTGVVVAEGIEALGKPLLFWRSFLQWIGGIGVVVLFIALLPALAVGGKFLYESEATGPSKEGLTPRIKETAVFLLKVYVGLTVLQVLLLLIVDMDMTVFDAVTLSLSTISTGGFTVQNCLNKYVNPTALWVLAVFMILGSINFSLYFYIVKRKFSQLKQPELIYYLVVLFVGSLLISWGLWNTPKDILNKPNEIFTFNEAFYYGSFEAISAQTSAGFSIINYDYWPFSCQLILIMLIYIGGMSGSTAGGIKMIRSIIAMKAIYNKIEAFFRPEVVRVLKVGNKEISDKTLSTVLIYFCIVIFLSLFGAYLLILDGNDLLTALAIVSTTINNAGLYFGGIGCSESLGFLSNFSKMISVVWMMLGRLEFFSLLVLLMPSFWKSQ